MKRLLLVLLGLFVLANPCFAAKFAPDAVMDAPLDLIDDATKLHLCTAAVTAYGDIATNCFFSHTMAGGDYTKADATSGADGADGRKLTVAEQADNTITGSANPSTVTHIALSNGTDTLYFVTTTTSQAVNDSEVWTAPAWKIVIGDPQ